MPRRPRRDGGKEQELTPFCLREGEEDEEHRRRCRQASERERAGRRRRVEASFFPPPRSLSLSAHTSLVFSKLLPQTMSSLKLQRRLAASVLGVGKRALWLDPTETAEIALANSREFSLLPFA